MDDIWRTALFLSAAAILRGETCEEGKRAFLAKDNSGAQQPLWNCVLDGAPNRDYAHQLTLTYRDLRNYDAGIARAEVALASQPPSPDILYVLAFLHFRLGRQTDSIRDLGQAYRLDKEDWRVHQLFALNYVVLNIKDGALASFQNAIRLKPRNSELYYQLARFYYSDNRPQESIEASRRALDIFPDYPEVFNNLGLCHEALASYDEARTNFERSIVLTEKTGARNEWPYIDYAAFLIKQDSAEQSLPLLRHAVEINPKSAKAYYFLGRALGKLSRKAEARRALEQSLSLDPNDPQPYYELGMLLNKMGEADAGQTMLRRFEAMRKRENP